VRKRTNYRSGGFERKGGWEERWGDAPVGEDKKEERGASMCLYESGGEKKLTNLLKRRSATRKRGGGKKIKMKGPLPGKEKEEGRGDGRGNAKTQEKKRGKKRGRWGRRIF